MNIPTSFSKEAAQQLNSVIEFFNKHKLNGSKWLVNLDRYLPAHSFTEHEVIAMGETADEIVNEHIIGKVPATKKAIQAINRQVTKINNTNMVNAPKAEAISAIQLLSFIAKRFVVSGSNVILA